MITVFNGDRQEIIDLAEPIKTFYNQQKLSPKLVATFLAEEKVGTIEVVLSRFYGYGIAVKEK
jgi:hypothetical protein